MTGEAEALPIEAAHIRHVCPHGRVVAWCCAGPHEEVVVPCPGDRPGGHDFNATQQPCPGGNPHGVPADVGEWLRHALDAAPPLWSRDRVNDLKTAIGAVIDLAEELDEPCLLEAVELLAWPLRDRVGYRKRWTRPTP